MNKQEIIEKLNFLTEKYGSGDAISTLGYAAAIRDVKGYLESLTTEPRVDKVTSEEIFTALKLEAAIYEANEDNMYIEQAFIDGAKWMQTYATQSNAEAMREHAIGFAEFVPNDMYISVDETNMLYNEYLTTLTK